MPNALSPTLPFREPVARASRVPLVRIKRRGPLLIPSPASPGVFGIDLTAGCPHGCPFCYVRGSALYPGPDRILFDPFSAETLTQLLATVRELPLRIVLSPTSDPLPVTSHEIRAETHAIVELLLRRGIEVVLLTRGAVPRSLISLLAAHKERARVELAFTTTDRALARILEPEAATPRTRLRSIERLIAADVPTVVRFEPLIAGLTDTREHVESLFRELAKRGASRVIAHYLYLQPAMIEPLRNALAPLGWQERVTEAYEGGPVFSIGSVGTTKHLPTERRREGLAKVFAWGAEHGLIVETGATQNPDFPRPRTQSQPEPIKEPRRAPRARSPQ
jgi:DNA repair photolyase